MMGYSSLLVRWGKCGCVIGVLVALCAAFSASGLAQIAVFEDLSYEFVVELGGRYEGLIPVKNTSQDVVGLKAYKRDYLFYADGTNIYGESGTVDRSNGPWITLLPLPVASLSPGETVYVRYVIQVPHEPSLLGTYWSMIMLEPKPPPASLSL